MDRATKPNVLFLDHVGVLGGAELSLLDIAGHFAERGHVALFADGPFRSRLQREGVRVSVLRASGSMLDVTREGGLLHDLTALPGVMRLAWRLAEQARAYDVLYANSQKALIVGTIAGLMARKPVLWHLRDVMIPQHFSPMHRRLTTFLANTFVARIIANSQATKEAFVANGGNPHRVEVVHNGIDSRPFVDPDRWSGPNGALREQLELDQSPAVGVFSRLAPWKGQHVLLEALSHLPHAHAVLVGAPLFGEDQRYARDLLQQAEALGLAARTHFLGFREDIPALMRCVDVVAHTSVAPEPFGRVIVEGMLAGRPVVATEAGGAVEIVEDRKTGRLIPPGDPLALARALRELFENPDQARRLAAAGREAALQRFSLQAMLTRVTTIVHEVSSEASSSRIAS